ncbi:MAG: ABC transporter substrate-binding protein [Dehalococcoidia bacterium]
MANGNFWTRREISRRSALRGAGLGIAGIAGAALIGCGDGDEDVAAPAARPAATAAPATTQATATAAAAATEAPSFLASRAVTTGPAGGIYLSSLTRDVTNLDPLAAESFTANTVGRWAYPQLLQYAPGIGGPVASGDVEPSLAESYTFPEPTKIILKLRKDAKWDAREPTNSRGVVAEDVVFSWNKFKEKSISRKSLANEVSDAAPILDITAVDDYTIEIKLAFAFGPILGSLAYSRWLQIEPQEADGGFDPRNDVRGAGPWMLTKYDRSVRMEFRKNPNYWLKDLPVLDGFDQPIIPEYAQRHAQFLAGRVWSSGGVNQQDLVNTVEELPYLNIFQGDWPRGNWQIYFGLRPGSPFRDERVRRAVSTMIDRDLITETFYGLGDLREAGWPVELRTHSVGVAGGYGPFWVDPKGDDYTEEQRKAFGPYPAEARKLMEAAGYGDGIETKWHYIATGQYGSTFPKVAEAYKGSFEADGLFRLQTQNPDYSTDYLPNIYFGQGDFEGIAWGASTIFPHVAQHLNSYYTSGGSRQKVAFKGDPTSVEGTAASDALVQKAILALDFEEQVELVRQWQRDNVLRMPFVPSGWPYGTPGFGLQPPWVMNYGSYRGYLESSELTTLPHWWIDEAKRKEILG